MYFLIDRVLLLSLIQTSLPSRNQTYNKFIKYCHLAFCHREQNEQYTRYERNDKQAH